MENDSSLDCPTAPTKHSVSAEASLSPADGGYRRLPDQVARQKLTNSISAALSSFGNGSTAKTNRALVAALDDLKPEITECFRKADPVVPNLQYTLRMDIDGAPGVGSIVRGVEVQRISESNGMQSITVKTRAEPCVAAILTLLELPPSSGYSRLFTTMRYDECHMRAPPDRVCVSVDGALDARWSAAARAPDVERKTKTFLDEVFAPMGAPYTVECHGLICRIDSGPSNGDWMVPLQIRWQKSCMAGICGMAFGSNGTFMELSSRNSSELCK
jgi:hypothetical protein